MHTFGACLIAVGVVSLITANLLHFNAEFKVMEKRPELYRRLYLWGVVRRHGLTDDAYQREFPASSRILYSRICAIAGFLALFSGFLVVVNFQ